MRALILAVLLVSFGAQAEPASRASIEKLLVLTNTEATIDALRAGMEQTMRQAMSQFVQGKDLNAEQRRVLDAMPGKLMAVMRHEMTWDAMKPKYVQIYRDTFDQAEIDGMLAFYGSPAGQAVITKMPVVMQKSMQLAQAQMQTLIPKMRAAMEEAVKEAHLPE